MALKSSFATALKALRGKRNLSQREFSDATSRTYLSKLESGRSSITLDKLDQVSERLELSPLTMVTLTLSEETGKTAADLMASLRAELEELQGGGGLPELENAMRGLLSSPPRGLRASAATSRARQVETPLE